MTTTSGPPNRSAATAAAAALPQSSVKLPAMFYHGTSWENWRQIRQDGLTLPGDNQRANYEGRLAARHDAVYLTTSFAGVYAANAALRGGHWNRLVLLEITVDGLATKNFTADEDAASVAGVERNWHKSLLAVGNVAYRNGISRGRIRRAVMLDMVRAGDLGALLVAPVTNPAYYAAHGKKYNLITRRIFGETVSGAEIYAAETERYEARNYIDFWNRLDIRTATTEL